MLRFFFQVEEALLRASDEDDRKRTRLTSMFESLVQIMGTNDSSVRQRFVEDFLSKDGTSSNIRDDCSKRVSDLQEREKVLLVAGTP